jgi:site-specific recombinase XerD
MKNRGFGTVYQPTYKDKKTGEYKKSAVWWIQYCRQGKVIRESSESTKESAARKLLKRCHGEIEAGRPVGPDVTRTTFEDMAAMVVNDYKANGYSSINRQEDAINHLRDFFGEHRAIEMTSDRVTAYIAHRQEEKAANSTIDNGLSALSRMFTLAMRAGKAGGKPYIGKLETNNARKGFFEGDQFEAVLKHLPGYLKPVAVTAYITGWRVHDELLTRERKHVDLKAGWLRLEPGETKNREGRNFPLTPRLREVLKAQIEHTEALSRAEGKIISWLFHREGKPIKDFRRAWKTALVKAGLGTEIRNRDGRLIKKVANRIPHDFRRTAVRNLERAGVSRSDAMNMVGHKTEAIYRRYAISDETSLKEAGAKLAMLETGFDKVLTKSEVF